jgi:hypothetical protein
MRHFAIRKILCPRHCVHHLVGERELPSPAIMCSSGRSGGFTSRSKMKHWPRQYSAEIPAFRF